MNSDRSTMSAEGSVPAKETLSTLAASASHLSTSAVQQTDSAERQVQLALIRTMLARERTYAAWIRTGLAALASGIGAKALLTSVIATWLVTATGSILIIFSGGCFVAASWRAIILDKTEADAAAHHLPVPLLLCVNGFLLMISVAALVGIWIVEV